jgi:hypothetical protein
VSLINEALKRTRDASFQAVAPGGMAAVPAYRVHSPSEHTPMRSNSAKLPWLMAAGTLVIAGVVLTLFLINNRWTPVVVVQEPTTPPPAVEERSHGVTVAEEALVAKLLDRMKAEQETTAPAPAPVVVKTVASPVASAPEPEPVKLVLQGVTIAGVTREAMINGMTVQEGESVEDAVVVAIESRRVRLNRGGREQVLRMP